jgi:hypothetical protein
MKPVALPDSIYSPDQIGSIMNDLNDYQTALRNSTAQKKLKSSAPQAAIASEQLLTVIKAAGLGDPSADELDELRKQLKELITTSPVAHVTFAATPSIAAKTAITTWFRKQVSPAMLLTFAVRTDIGGGAIVRCGSHIYDFSFRNLLLTNKQKIAEIVSRV